MATTTSRGTCKAKDPNTCPYHGTVLQMDAAQAAGDVKAYLALKDKVEAMKPEKDAEKERASIVKPRPTLKLEMDAVDLRKINFDAPEIASHTQFIRATTQITADSNDAKMHLLEQGRGFPPEAARLVELRDQINQTIEDPRIVLSAERHAYAVNQAHQLELTLEELTPGRFKTKEELRTHLVALHRRASNHAGMKASEMRARQQDNNPQRLAETHALSAVANVLAEAVDRLSG